MVIILATGQGIIVTKCERWNSWGCKLRKKKNQSWIPSILFWTVCSRGIHHNNKFNEIVPICLNGPFHTKIRSNLKQIFFYTFFFFFFQMMSQFFQHLQHFSPRCEAWWHVLLYYFSFINIIIKSKWCNIVKTYYYYKWKHVVMHVS